MKVYALSLAVLAAAACKKTNSRLPTKAKGTADIVSSGFADPGGIAHDPANDVYYLANTNGGPFDADANGYISVVSPRGDTLNAHWIVSGVGGVTLNAPKGIAVNYGIVWVADINTVRGFDVRTGAPRGSATIAGATDLTHIVPRPDGTIYITDTGLRGGTLGPQPSGTDAIYHVDLNFKIDTVARGVALGQPTGIALSADTSIWVVNRKGQFARVVNGKLADVRQVANGPLTGLYIYNEEAFIAGEDGTLYRGPLTGGSIRALLAGGNNPIDLEHDEWRNRILVVLGKEKAVEFIPLVDPSLVPFNR